MASNCYFQFFAVVITFLGLASTGDAIRCFQCNSQQDYSCMDPFSSTRRVQLVDCDRSTAHNTYLQGYSVCRKVVTRDRGEYIVERGCAYSQGGYSRYNDNLCPRDTTFGIVDHCSTCTTDACNGASALVPTVWSSLVITSLLYMGVKFL